MAAALRECALARLDVVELAAPFDSLSSTLGLVLLALLTVADFVGDKIPLVDHVLHLAGAVVAPASGAILFAGQTGLETDLPTLAAVLLGGATAGSIHAGRSAVRPVSTRPRRLGNPLLSLARISARSCSSSWRSSCRCSRCCSCSRSRSRSCPRAAGSAAAALTADRPATLRRLLLRPPHRRARRAARPARARPGARRAGRPLDVYLGHIEPLSLDWPADGTMTDGYGPRWGRMHLGVDVGILRSLDVAAAAGTVTAAGWLTGYEGYGNVVTVDIGDGYSILYAPVGGAGRAGQWVNDGDPIGQAGCTGSCTGRTCTSSCAGTACRSTRSPISGRAISPVGVMAPAGAGLRCALPMTRTLPLRSALVVLLASLVVAPAASARLDSSRVSR